MIQKILLLEKFNLNSRLNELDYYFKNLNLNQEDRRIDFVNSKEQIIFYCYDYGFIDIENINNNLNNNLNNKNIQKYIYNLHINLSYLKKLNCFHHLKKYDDNDIIGLVFLFKKWFYTRKNIEIVYFEIVHQEPLKQQALSQYAKTPIIL